ncbi:MAG TPA: ArsC/Spx/MgsR family protein [Pyrinomonadaceae bacterium]|nr:ArsC/Spx/MgsR family protein [Pyrinomonadaceae bacterium]HMP67041.1 ArsC/Spx/MgsR family protein [Pyrinomonadaceae bacterium]
MGVRPKITIYEKPTCTTCRNLAVLLKENGIDYDKQNYFVEPLTADDIKKLLKKLKIPAFGLLRTKEKEFKERGFAPDTLESEIIEAIVANPGLLNRPIVVAGDRAIIARPIEKALELVDTK